MLRKTTRVIPPRPPCKYCPSRCCYFRHCFSLSWILLSRLGWLASEPQRFACLGLSSSGITSTCHHMQLCLAWFLKIKLRSYGSSTLFPALYQPFWNACYESYVVLAFPLKPHTRHALRSHSMMSDLEPPSVLRHEMPVDSRENEALNSSPFLFLPPVGLWLIRPLSNLIKGV